MKSNDNLRTLVIVNPASAGGGTRRRWNQIARAIQTAIGPFEHAFTKAPLHAVNLAGQAINEGYEMVVAVGGDGTFNEVASGFFNENQIASENKVFGIVPHGTGSDFARSLGLSNIEQACARLQNRAFRLIDVGHAKFIKHNDQPFERIFLNVASFGCSGHVTKILSQKLKKVSGSLAYTLASFQALLGHQDMNVTITSDKESARDLLITNCSIANGRYFGGGIKVAPYAEVDDGVFDITIWSGFGLADFIVKRKALWSGAHISESGTLVFRASEVIASSATCVPFELDGESVGFLPVSIKILPASLRLKI
jgi:YegS/Rv2252/BmrU family lipid kinase